MGQANGAIQSGAKIEDEFHVQKVPSGEAFSRGKVDEW